MNGLGKVSIVFLFLVFITPFILLAESDSLNVDVETVVKKIDDLYRSESSYATLEMEIVTPHWERTLTMEAWSKGTDKTFIVITSPKKEKGVATLRIGNEMWNYLPKTNKVIKIPPSMMTASWMGSDFTNDDLVKESSMLDDYHYKFVSPEDAQEDLLYIQLIPKEDSPIVWGKIIVAVRKNDYIPVREKYFNEKGNLMRVMNFKKVKQFGDRKIPSLMEMIPQNKKGKKTVIRYLDVQFDITIREDIFSLRNLRKER